jgi:hypothetical protein
MSDTCTTSAPNDFLNVCTQSTTVFMKLKSIKQRRAHSKRDELFGQADGRVQANLSKMRNESVIHSSILNYTVDTHESSVK